MCYRSEMKKTFLRAGLGSFIVALTLDGMDRIQWADRFWLSTVICLFTLAILMARGKVEEE